MHTSPFSFAFLTSLALAASSIEFVADSDESSVNGLGLSSIHEGAGINYFLLGSGSQTLQFDEETGTVYANLTDTITQFVSVSSANIVQLSVESPQKVTVADSVVSIDGNDSFYACKNINDPYRYTEKSFAILSKNGDGCFPMKIKIKDGQTPSASETPSKPSNIPGISSIPENGANFKSAGSIVGAAAIIAAIL